MIHLFLKECPAMAAPAQTVKLSAGNLHIKDAANSTMDFPSKIIIALTLNLCTLYRQIDTTKNKNKRNEKKITEEKTASSHLEKIADNRVEGYLLPGCIFKIKRETQDSAAEKGPSNA
jgi:hypothetical protein